MKEEARQARGQRLVESVARDVAYALRVLRKSPGFTTAVVFSLALGIGANTAIFTLMDAVMWRMLPVKDPEGLLVAGRQQRRHGPARVHLQAVPSDTGRQFGGERGGICDRSHQCERRRASGAEPSRVSSCPATISRCWA